MDQQDLLAHKDQQDQQVRQDLLVPLVQMETTVQMGAPAPQVPQVPQDLLEPPQVSVRQRQALVP